MDTKAETPNGLIGNLYLLYTQACSASKYRTTIQYNTTRGHENLDKTLRVLKHTVILYLMTNNFSFNLYLYFRVSDRMLAKCLLGNWKTSMKLPVKVRYKLILKNISTISVSYLGNCPPDEC